MGMWKLFRHRKFCRPMKGPDRAQIIELGSKRLIQRIGQKSGRSLQLANDAIMVGAIVGRADQVQ